MKAQPSLALAFKRKSMLPFTSMISNGARAELSGAEANKYSLFRASC